ncbi:activator of Hsp90 ATPase [Blastocladiella britannica]|nr:activator of Hsp90 ATPase [Blastocladiella britannica]
MAQTATPTEDKNWKNVGNWHWVTKDALPFAKDYLAANLAGVQVRDDRVEARITKATDIAGDCSLNVRKGKLITIYDLTLTLHWTATLAGTTGTEPVTATGTVSIPEIAHDTERGDLVLQISVDADARAKDPIRAALRKHLAAALWPVLDQFPKALVASQADGVFIEGAVTSAALPTADLEERKRLAAQMDTGASFADTFSVEQRMNKGKERAAAAAASSSASSASGSAARPSATTASSSSTSSSTAAAPAAAAAPKTTATSSTIVTKSVSLHCALHDATSTFTNLGKLQHWTQGAASFDELSRVWSIFAGQATAELKPETKPELVVLASWRLASWPAGTVSTATLTFKQTSDGTDVKVLHVGVPVDARAAVENHWSMVFNRIKMSFGYGSFL